MSWIVVNKGFGEISTRDVIMKSSAIKTKERFNCGWERGNLSRQTEHRSIWSPMITTRDYEVSYLQSANCYDSITTLH